MSHFIRHFVMLSGLSLFILNLQAGEPNRPSRLALVIGNAAYAEKPLKNPVNDAKDMAKVLKGLGFEVILETDVDLDKMIKALQKFGNQLSDGGVGLFYFSGHGIQYNNLNYLIPIDVNNLEDDELVIKRQTLEVDDVLSRMEGNNKKGVNIIILDACRNNPFGGRGFKGVPSGGLAEMRAPIGSLIAYATAPNTIAKDNPRGLNGMYTKHLLAALREMPQESVLDLFTEVTGRVVIETNEQQVPWKADSLRGKFCLATRGCGRVAIQPSVEEIKVTPSQVPSIPKSTANTPPVLPSSVDNQGTGYGIVQKGDTLYGFAKRYGRSVAEVASWNGLQPPYLLDVGQTLIVSISMDCRNFTTEIMTPDGKRKSEEERACRGSNGEWHYLIPIVPTSSVKTILVPPLTIDKEQSRDIMDYDQQQANHALEYKLVGQTFVWKNPYNNTGYEVTPTKTYETRQGPCREYEIVSIIEGQRSVFYGKACRQPDGSWKRGDN
ncbi:MAG: hypothetical protein BWK78_02640 [Thiotrichaceae bacterium IS1]|nr:MAG: hypothetical protein BWK78_02640 [Thiotrichaceae bacterium IS1]